MAVGNKKPRKVKQSVILAAEQLDAVCRNAQARDVSVSLVIREALTIGLRAMGLLKAAA